MISYRVFYQRLVPRAAYPAPPLRDTTRCLPVHVWMVTMARRFISRSALLLFFLSLVTLPSLFASLSSLYEFVMLPMSTSAAYTYTGWGAGRGICNVQTYVYIYGYVYFSPVLVRGLCIHIHINIYIYIYIYIYLYPDIANGIDVIWYVCKLRTYGYVYFSPVLVWALCTDTFIYMAYAYIYIYIFIFRRIEG